MKKILTVLSFTLVAMVTNAQTKKFLIDHYVENSRPEWNWQPFGDMKIVISPDYIKVDNVGVVSTYNVISRKKGKNDTMVYKVKDVEGNIREFRLLEREKFIEYIEKSATIDNGKRYYYDLQG